MALPALVLVHGGAHGADCWDLTVDEIHRLAPDLKVLAVDLPGRRGKPGNLETDTIADCGGLIRVRERSSARAAGLFSIGFTRTPRTSPQHRGDRRCADRR